MWSAESQRYYASRVIRLMADWLIHLLLRIGGTAALLAGAGFVMGKWLWAKIDAALESYTSAYEKLDEEQARLTRAVEAIKDEIAGQRKMHDTFRVCRNI